MHINFDQAEDLEMFLASEFVNEDYGPVILLNHNYDVGYKILDFLSLNLALNISV